MTGNYSKYEILIQHHRPESGLHPVSPYLANMRNKEEHEEFHGKDAGKLAIMAGKTIAMWEHSDD